MKSDHGGITDLGTDDEDNAQHEQHRANFQTMANMFVGVGRLTRKSFVEPMADQSTYAI